MVRVQASTPPYLSSLLRARVVEWRRPDATLPDLSAAFPFAQVQKEVAELIKDKIIVGHGLKNDFKVRARTQHTHTHTHMLCGFIF
jgi:RNA exonuclease 4